METILSIQNLHKNYGSVHAVSNISFQIQKGFVYGILGPNGSGKSTTLGIVLNVVNKTSGEFSWFDGRMSTHDALKKVGAIIERPNFYPYMTAAENLQLVAKIKGVSVEKVDEKLELVGLLERKDSKFKTFSLGMKQRLAIASALLNDPEILILDEPTNGLDPQGIRQIRDLIHLISSQGTTILLASHLLDEVEKVCTHVIVLQKGKMLFSGRVHEMMNAKDFFELKAENNTRLEEILLQHPEIESVLVENQFLRANFKHDVSASNLNQYLMNHGVCLSHLVQRKNSLEEQFLAITRNTEK